MRDVLSWVADPDAAAAEVHRFLRRSPQPAYESEECGIQCASGRVLGRFIITLSWLFNALVTLDQL